MFGSQYVGMGLWLLGKVDELKNAYELYEATHSESAAIDVATKLSEIAAGLAVGFVVTSAVEAVQKTGLDRVFDSISACRLG